MDFALAALTHTSLGLSVWLEKIRTTDSRKKTVLLAFQVSCYGWLDISLSSSTSSHSTMMEAPSKRQISLLLWRKQESGDRPLALQKSCSRNLGHRNLASFG